MKVPFVDLVTQHREVEKEVRARLEEGIRSSLFILGPAVEQFEEAMARYHGVRHAVGVASGTDALLLSLLAAGVKTGDEVIAVYAQLPRLVFPFLMNKSMSGNDKPDASVCKPPNKAARVWWEYEWGPLQEVRDYTLYIKVWTDPPLPDGFAYDKDGKPDINTWFSDNTVTITVVEPLP